MDICLKRRNMETDVTPMTPASSIVSALRISDDSGYHTSFTPSSIELSEVSNENLDPKLFYSRSLTDRDALFHIFSPKRRRLKSSGADGNYENTPDSPPSRRGRKRRAEFEVKVDNSAPTPTSYITGGIQNLHLSKANELLNSVNYSQSVQINWSESDCSDVLYPTTPVKKYKINKYSPTYYIKSSPKRSNSTVCPPKKSLKKLNFDPQINETLNECQKDVKEKYTKKTLKSMKYKPDDIMEMLRNANPVINKIFSYLDNQDIYNFSLVSPVWYSVCINNSEANYRRNEYIDYVNSTKENYKNRDKCKEGEVDRSIEKREQPAKALKDSNNSLNTQTHSKRSPPGTPRTIKFKKFTKVIIHLLIMILILFIISFYIVLLLYVSVIEFIYCHFFQSCIKASLE